MGTRLLNLVTSASRVWLGWERVSSAAPHKLGHLFLYHLLSASHIVSSMPGTPPAPVIPTTPDQRELPPLQMRKPSHIALHFSFEERPTNDIILPVNHIHFSNIKLLKIPIPKISREELKESLESRAYLSPAWSPRALLWWTPGQHLHLSAWSLSLALGNPCPLLPPSQHHHHQGTAEGRKN